MDNGKFRTSARGVGRKHQTRMTVRRALGLFAERHCWDDMANVMIDRACDSTVKRSSSPCYSSPAVMATNLCPENEAFAGFSRNTETATHTQPGFPRLLSV